jgi:Bifunctional DNA primase/polymerase, N-terminal
MNTVLPEKGQVLAAALQCAARGWQVIPLKPLGKLPAVKFAEATTNPAKLKRWFAQGWPYNLGILTGTVSGVFVFDVDGSNGAVSLADLERKHGPLPRTLISFTSSGCHFWFKCDRPIQTSVGKIATGIDIRADGGLVVAPPSVHETGAIYRWSNSAPIANAPAWLIELTRKKTISERALDNVRRPPNSLPGNSSCYGNAALDREIKELAAVPPGARNEALNLCAFRLFQLVAGGELGRDQVRDRLLDACHSNRLIEDDGLISVQKTIKSAYKAGIKHPRRRKP